MIKLEEMEMTFPCGSKAKLLDHFKRDDFIETEEGEIFVRLASLLRVAKETLVVQEYHCTIEQVPVENNEWCATVRARYVFRGDIMFSGAADCRTSNASAGFDKYTVALAEARAKARALRDALGVEICSSEEIAGKKGKKERSFVTESGDEKIESTQIMLIEKKFLGEAKKTMEDIQKIVGHEVKKIEDLTKEEGSQILEAFNKNKKQKEEVCKH